MLLEISNRLIYWTLVSRQPLSVASHATTFQSRAGLGGDAQQSPRAVPSSAQPGQAKGAPQAVSDNDGWHNTTLAIRRVPTARCTASQAPPAPASWHKKSARQ